MARDCEASDGILRYSLELPGGVRTRQRGGEGGPGGDDGRVGGVGVGVASEGQRGVQLGRGAGGRRQGRRGLRGDVGDPHHRLVLGVPVDDGICTSITLKRCCCQ